MLETVAPFHSPPLLLGSAALTWTLEIGFLVYVVAITIIVVLERRRPNATIALVLALIFLPVFGALAYFLFGRRLKRRLRLRRRRIIRPVDATRGFAAAVELPAGATPNQRGLVRLALRTAAAPVRHASEVKLHSEPHATFDAMLEMIDRAEHYVHLLFYIWRDDATGREFVARLAARARIGVRVRVLLDHLGSFGVDETHFAPLLEAGGELGWFGRLRIPWRPWRNTVNFRNHRKILVADGQRGFVGGVNVGDEYRGTGASLRGWQDVMMDLSGDAVVGLDAVFLEDWLVSTGQVVDIYGHRSVALAHVDARRPSGRNWLRKRPRDTALREHDPYGSLPRRAPAAAGPLVQIIPSGPDAPVADAIGTQIVAAVACAFTRVWIVTPYLIPDEPLLLALRTAALRGVDVRLIVPAEAHNDSRLAALAAASYYDELFEAGARIFEYQAGMLHSKYAVFDDVALVGSANMDVRSFHLNYEVVAMFYDAAVTTSMIDRFALDLVDSLEVTAPARRGLGWQRRLAEGFARVLSPLL